MFLNTSRRAVGIEFDAARPIADPHLRRRVLLIGIFVLLYCVIFFWASSRGYEFFDEAFDLVIIANPFAYTGVSDFGQLWHPLYLALHGSIGWFRIAGFLLLSACGALFGLAVARFSDARAGLSATSLVVIQGVAICVSWQYQTWKATPDYNMLNLCALLLFFSGLLAPAQRNSAVETASSFWRDIFCPSVLCAVGVSVMVLTKATTAVLAVLSGFVWIMFLPPRRPLACLALTALLATGLLAFAMIAIDGSILAFVAGKIRAFDLLRPPGAGGDVHGIATSVVGPLTKEWWKIVEALFCAAILFGLGLAWSLLLPSARSGKGWPWAGSAIAAAIAILVLWWRVQDIEFPEAFMGFRVWRLPLAFVLIAFTVRILWLTGLPTDGSRARILLAAGILAIAPIAYSFGTGNLIIWHAAGAGIFWAAAMMLLTGLLPPSMRDDGKSGIALFCVLTSIGLLFGVMIAPGRIGAPVWEQAVTVRLGRRATHLTINPTAADYIESFQAAARKNGFGNDTPVIDLSEMGLGLSFALGARPLGALPWLISDGGLAKKSERRATIALQAASVPKQLADTPVADLRRAWLITGDPEYLDLMRPVLTSLGLNFPEGYRIVSRTSRSDTGWTQILWKPVD